MAKAKHKKTAWQVRSGKLHELSVKVSAMPAAASYERKAAGSKVGTDRSGAKKAAE